MELTATSFSDIGNIVEVGNLNDDLGGDLLANTRYSGPSVEISQPSQGNSVSIDMPRGGGLDEIDIGKMETLETVNLDFSTPAPPPSISVQREAPSSFQPANGFGADGSFANLQSASGPSIQLTPQTSVDPQKELLEKAEFINKLQRLEAKGFPVSKRFTMDNSLDEIKTEYTRLVDARQLETSIRFQRNMLMGLVTGVEWMNNKFDPFDLKLDGWSEGVHENIEDYDEIFEELYDKYKERGKMPPEARLMFQLAGSGFMCHVTNSFFRSKMPSADDIFKKNPELAKQFAAAAAQQASPGFGNFMGMAMGVPQGGQQPSMPQAPMGVPLGMAAGPAPANPAGAFFQSPHMPQHAAAAPPAQTARREMKGPSGVEDILKTFEEVRNAQDQQMPSMPPSMPSMPPSMAAVSELQSLAGSDDLGSVGTERTSGGGRRRRQRAPIGNVVSLNV